MTRERKDIAEARISAMNSVNKSILDCNKVTKKAQTNIDELKELKHGVEQTKADIRSNRSNLDNGTRELQDVQAVLQDTKAMIAAVDKERQSMFTQLNKGDHQNAEEL